jgi:hypothetical protein
MKIQILLISVQPIPNLVSLKVKELVPDLVILVVSKDMKLQEERFKKVLQAWNIKTVLSIEIEPLDFNSSKITFLELLNQYSKDELILNITGGTKILTLAAYEVFFRFAKVIYVDTSESKIKIITSNESIPFDNWIDVKSYLLSYGQECIGDKSKEFIQKSNLYKFFLMDLIKDVCSNENFPLGISNLNYYATKAQYKNDYNQIIDSDHLEGLYEILNVFKKHKFLEFDDKSINFNIELISFVKGGWLEAYVYYILSNISGINLLSDAKININNRESYTKNEYDAVFTLNNKLFLIECKTTSNKFDQVTDYLYKLNSLKTFAGGTFAKALLICTSEITKSSLDRANYYNISTTSDLRNLKQEILNWIK